MKILICDDQDDRAEEVNGMVAQGIPGAEITKLSGDELAGQLKRLFERVTLRLDSPDNAATTASLAFDNADIALIDNNLTHLDIGGARLTAESIIGYVRAFTSVPYIVSLNKNSDVDFDLRYLLGDYETRADIALNTEHLRRPRLWVKAAGNLDDGFLPWYWPELSAAFVARQEQIAFVQSSIDSTVFDKLGFPSDQDSLSFLSLHAMGALYPPAEGVKGAPDGKSLAKVSFRDVFEGGRRSLPIELERKAILDAAGRGNALAIETIARVVAADVDHWMRRDVLGPQEMLVDLPHLLLRMPFLLGDGAADLTQWNRALALPWSPPFGTDSTLFAEHVAGVRFAHAMWTSAPAFWWPQLKANKILNELFFASRSEQWKDAVFCEDVSEFRERTPTSGSTPAEFTAEFEGSWVMRHVARIDGIRYSPKTRFAV